MSHQARTFTSIYVDLCSNCLSLANAAKNDAERETAAPYQEAQDRANAARESLINLGSPDLSSRSRRVINGQKTLFGYRDTFVDVEPAWPVGRLKVVIPERWNSGPVGKIAECGVTREGRVVTMDPDDPGKFEHFELARTYFWARIGTDAILKELEQIAACLESIFRRHHLG